MSPREKRSARDVALDALMQVDKANAWSDEALRRLVMDVWMRQQKLQ